MNPPPTVSLRAVFASLTMLMLGCASAPGRPERVGIALDELLAGAPLGVAGQRPSLIAEQDVLAVSAEMEDFLSTHVALTADGATRFRQLVDAIIGKATFGLQYDETTRTASETFRTRRGNCLAFSTMFVAMARRLGLDARYQEVDIPPDWSFRDDAFVLNRHVNVLVDLGRGARTEERLGTLIRVPVREGERVVDFNLEDFRTGYDRRPISDARALAHYYNNVAVESMRAGQTASALQYFRRAAEKDPLFSPIWTNLGILYLRKGHPVHAEAAYLQALRADAGDLVAMSNLASLYERLGDRRRAALYRKRVVDHRERNPYYRFQLARKAFLAQDYDAAIGHLQYAVRKKRKEHQFCFLLGLSYMKKGDEGAARRWLARAEEIAATTDLKSLHSSKIDRLISAPPDEDSLQ